MKQILSKAARPNTIPQLKKATTSFGLHASFTHRLHASFTNRFLLFLSAFLLAGIILAATKQDGVYSSLSLLTSVILSYY